MSENRKIGKVIFFKGSFGFISRENEKDIFLHWSDISNDYNKNIKNKSTYKTLKKDQVVEFSVGKNYYDQDKAIDVIILEDPNEKK